MKVMIVVTHLLGTGHLARALTLSRAFTAAGDETCVVSGGTAAPLLLRPQDNIIQLPAVRSDGIDFSRLLTETGAEATAEHMTARHVQLLEALHNFAPDILITELFPFGRRILRVEFAALLEAAKAMQRRPLICASIRDILAPPSKPKKAIFADEMVRANYDMVLVHSDEAVMPLGLSWPVSDVLRPMLHYTGFVAPPVAVPHPNHAGRGEIIVSAGGGSVGGPVYAAALAAAQLMPNPMRLLVGGTTAQERMRDLRRTAPDNVIIEETRPDFRQMLHHAAASVSLCGYNTALDILQAGTPAVFIPFDDGSEVEQGLRARALASREGIACLARADLTGEALCSSLAAVMAAPRRNFSDIRFDGAARTITITRARRREMT
ncbi:glycosyltransferase family protein [Sulfitobacter guttiformis]|uniref:Putative glycosyltransferase n=1 Tax=Sulfitobacter guttiformis TaxID=74349 RepID=A0A420DU25_9RHOB|nr:glycosyltransferase [Sulfitobacter guttiformis]KIN71177.1 Glycosyltransferase family 28 C-terminal domain [Sulfitobacter guttiformis KCTC 32187]RKE97649.1 putative glycosyltransferase [Sulfitobacter guttiformis]